MDTYNADQTAMGTPRGIVKTIYSGPVTKDQSNGSDQPKGY